jgi:hypothetical protein
MIVRPRTGTGRLENVVYAEPHGKVGLHIQGRHHANAQEL